MSVSAALVDSILELRLRDNFSMEDVMEAFALGLSVSSPDLRPSVLLDVTESSGPKSMDELREFAQCIAPHLEELQARVSILFDSQQSDLTTETQRFCKFVENEGFSAACFSDRDESLSFLRSAQPLHKH